MKSGLLSAMAYFGPARREEMTVRKDVERRIIDFLEIDHIRRQPVASIGCREAARRTNMFRNIVKKGRRIAGFGSLLAALTVAAPAMAQDKEPIVLGGSMPV